MFSATWPRSVQRMAASFLNRAVQINIGNSDELVLNSDVTQVLTLDQQTKYRYRGISPVRKRQPLRTPLGP